MENARKQTRVNGEPVMHKRGIHVGDVITTSEGTTIQVTGISPYSPQSLRGLLEGAAREAESSQDYLDKVALASWNSCRQLWDNEPDFSAEELEALVERGYIPLERVGQGNTRDAIRARFIPVEKNRILKRQKFEVNGDSVTTAINTARKDVHGAELFAARGISHPNLAEIVDQFTINGRRYHAELDIGGVDLRSDLHLCGRMRDGATAYSVIGQLLAATKYLHAHLKVHRDIKPENVIVTRDGRVVLTDLQNVGAMNMPSVGVVPTKGATPYARPVLINAFMHGNEHVPGQRDDIHALGATIFYLFTGQNAFPYSMRSDENGNSVQIGDTTYHVGLYDNGNRVEAITPAIHRAHIHKAEQLMRDHDVPKQWRALVTNALDHE